MSVTKEQFLADVKHEVEQLKKHATPSEIGGLDLFSLNPKSQITCIYGQMTGNCESRRAKELMDLSCIRVLDVFNGVANILDQDIESEEFNINGEYEGQTWKATRVFGVRSYRYLSALEGYICTKNAKNHEIIAYLKGHTQTLEL